MPFDYGASVQSGDPFKLWPTEGSRVALVDGDMLPYIVGYTAEEMRTVRALTSARFLLGLTEVPATVDEEWYQACLAQPYFREKISHINTLLNQWVSEAEADAAKIYMTTSASNYRLDVAFQKVYKGERVKSKPPFFYELRYHLATRHGAIVADGNEADDLMSIEQWRDIRDHLGDGGDYNSYKNMANTIIVSLDKDLRITPGHHCIPRNQHNKQSVFEYYDYIGELKPVYKDKLKTVYRYWPMIKGKVVDPETLDNYDACDRYQKGKQAGELKKKRVNLGKELQPCIDSLKGGGLRFFYAQLIMGDTVDNYPGIKNKGATDAYAVLKDLTDEAAMKKAVFDLYASAYSGGTNDPVWIQNYRGQMALVTPKQLMAEQGRLAWMQTKPGELWADHIDVPTMKDDVWQENSNSGS